MKRPVLGFRPLPLGHRYLMLWFPVPRPLVDAELIPDPY